MLIDKYDKKILMMNIIVPILIVAIMFLLKFLELSVKVRAIAFAYLIIQYSISHRLYRNYLERLELSEKLGLPDDST